MKKIELNNINYEIVKDYKNSLNIENLEELITDYFEDYDFIVGDWSYGKLRLKGFYDKKNEKCIDINNINNIEEYLKEYCSYDCSHFILKKLK